MSVQQFDSNGNPITIPDAVASPDQQVADTTGTLINPAKEDGNLLSVKTNTDKLDTNLSTRASESTLSIASSTLTGIKGKTDQLTFSGTALTIDGSATIQPISATSLPLPTGASTEATLSALNTKVTTTANGVKVDGSAATQPISATSLPLPTGAATEATLSSINGKDFATQTTLSSLNSKDFATQTTLSSIKTDTGNLDVFLSTRASETNLTSVKTKMADGTQKTQVVDGVGNVVGSTGNALDVNIKSGVTIDVSLDHSTDNVLIYGNDGTNDQKIKTDASGNVQVGGSVSASQSGSWSVSVGNFPAVQPVSGTVAATQSGAWTVAATQSGGWTVTANAGTGTFNVAGTVTANIGTTNGLALDSTLTGGSQKTKIVDSAGTNVATVSAAGAVKVDGSATTQPISASSLPLPTGASTEATLLSVKADLDNLTFSSTRLVVDGSQVTQPVSGTFWQATQPISATSLPLPTGASTEATLSALNTKVTTTANGVKVDGSAVTQPVSGTFWQTTQPISAASLPLPTGAATEATLSALNTKVTTTANGIKIDGTATTQPISATSLPLPTGASTETTLSSINTKLVSGTVIGDVNAAQKGTWSVRTQDGSGTALTSSLVNTRQALDIHQADTTFIVSGLSAVGVAPSLNPISVSGVDNGGLKRHIKTDSSGNLQTGEEYSSNDVLFFLDTGVANSTAVNHDTTPGNGVIWDIESVTFGQALWNTNKVSGHVQVIWDPAGANKTLAYSYGASGDSIETPIHYRITGNGTKVLRVINVNGTTGASDLASTLNYNVVS